MTNSSTSSYKIPRFDGEPGKFATWRLNVHVVFRANDWMKFIEESKEKSIAPTRSRESFGHVKEESDKDDDEAKARAKKAQADEEERISNYQKASRETRMQHDKAFAALWMSLGPTVQNLFSTILQEGNVREWYDEICKKYGKTSIHDCAILMTEILSAQYRSNDDVDTFVASMLQKNQLLTASKNGFSELQMKVFITRALPVEYSPVISTLRYADQLQQRTVQEISAMLKIHQQEVIRGGASSSASAHHVSSRNHGKSHGKAANHSSSSSSSANCFRCGKRGHLAPKCDTPAEGLSCTVSGCDKPKGDHSNGGHHARAAFHAKRKSTSAPAPPSAPVTHVLLASDSVLSASSSSSIDKVSMIIDSGATKSFVHDIRLLQNVRPCDEIIVRTADNRQHKSNMIGTCPLLLSNGSMLEITNARYCPGLAVNLLSVKQVLNNGARVTFKKSNGVHSACITTSAGAPIVVPASGDLFVLECESKLIQHAHSVSSVSASSGGVDDISGAVGDRDDLMISHSDRIRERSLIISEDACATIGDHAHAVVDIDIWHKRFGHLSKSGMTKLIKSGSVVGLDVTAEQSELLSPCSHCEIAKAKRRSFADHKTTHATAPMHHISADLCGVKDDSHPGGRHMLVLVDTFSRMKTVRIIDRKSDAEQQIIDFIKIQQNRTGNKLKVFHSDGGGEFISTNFKRWLTDNGIDKTTTLTATPAHNAIVERANRSLMEKVRALMLHAKAPEKFWPYAAHYAAYVLNRSLTKGTTEQGVTPYQLWFGHSPSVANLRVMFCDCFVHDDSPANAKLSARASRAFFLGIDETRNDYCAYLCWDIDNDKLLTSRNVTFNERSFAHIADYKRISNIVDSDYMMFDVDDLLSNEIELAKIISLEEQQPVAAASEGDGHESIIRERSPIIPAVVSNGDRHETIIRERSPFIQTRDYRKDGDVSTDRILSYKRQRVKANHSYKFDPKDVGARFVGDVGTIHHAFALTDVSFSDPTTYREAMASRNAAQWTAAMQSEYQSMIDNDVFEEVDPPDGVHVMGSRFVFKTKMNSTGAIEKHKARLVAQGFTQTPDEYGETYAPTLRLDTLRTLLAIGVKLNYALKQMDVCTAFLNAPLKERIFMRPPEGLQFTRGKVLRLKRSIYGLKQSPHEWHQLLTDYLRSLDWQQSKIDPCLFYKISRTNHVMYMGVFVDDLICGYDQQHDSDEHIEFKSAFTARFKTTDIGDVDWILGMKVERDVTNGTLFLHQRLYTEKVLKTFNMDTCKPVSSPEDANIKLSRDDSPSPSHDDYDAHVDEMRRTPYAAVVGSLLYLSICTRPDIAHSVHVLTRFMHNPGRAHWQYAKRVLRYLRGTTNYGLLYSRNNGASIAASSTAHAAPHDSVLQRSTILRERSLIISTDDERDESHSDIFRERSLILADNDVSISSMSDANFGSDRIISTTDRNYRSTTGSLFFVGGNLIAWDSYLQSTVAQSTCEAEYVAACQTANKTVAFANLLDELHFDTSSTPSIIHVDNQAAISVANNIYSGRSVRHMAIPWHVLKDYVNNKQVQLQWISTKSQLADIMTKAMKPDAFILLRDQLVTQH